jgi:hypothetical protein
MGRNGPSPPPLVEPLNALNTLAAGDDPSLVDAAETDEAGRGELGRAECDGRDGAVASASAAAATPAGPCAASARWVEAGIAPPPPPLPPPALPPPAPPPLEVPPGPPGWLAEPLTGCTVLVGRPPPAVGTVSTYWLTPEFPGGARVRPDASAEAGTASTMASAIATRLTNGNTFDGRVG